MRLNIRPVQDIISKKLEQMMLKMKMGKTTETRVVPIEVIRISGLESILAKVGGRVIQMLQLSQHFRNCSLQNVINVFAFLVLHANKLCNSNV